MDTKSNSSYNSIIRQNIPSKINFDSTHEYLEYEYLEKIQLYAIKIYFVISTSPNAIL